jgi:hypothetical protein
MLVLSGIYQWDWEWGAFITFAGCEKPLGAPENGLIRARTRTSSGSLLQGRARVVFEGEIVPAHACAWQGEPKPASNCDYFEVKQIDRFELE